MFKTIQALKTALVQTGQVEEANIMQIELSSDEYMYVDKTNPKVPLGYASETYRGVIPGHGKMWDINARFA